MYAPKIKLGLALIKGLEHDSVEVWIAHRTQQQQQQQTVMIIFFHCLRAHDYKSMYYILKLLLFFFLNEQEMSLIKPLEPEHTIHG